MASYDLLWVVNYDDPFYPKLVKLDRGPLGIREPDEGKTFEAAKKELLDFLRSKHRHWLNRLKEARALTPQNYDT